MLPAAALIGMEPKSLPCCEPAASHMRRSVQAPLAACACMPPLSGAASGRHCAGAARARLPALAPGRDPAPAAAQVPHVLLRQRGRDRPGPPRRARVQRVRVAAAGGPARQGAPVRANCVCCETARAARHTPACVTAFQNNARASEHCGSSIEPRSALLRRAVEPA